MSNPIDTNNTNTSNLVNTNNDDTSNEQTEQIEYYRRLVLTFIEKNKHDLLKIYLQHKETASDEDKLAVLGVQLFFEDEPIPKIDVAYLPLQILSQELINIVNERIQVNNEHIIYFLMITPCEQQILELDIRTLQ